MLSVSEWHQRFIQQANWTTEIRNYLFEKAQFQPNNFILEIGCGTGAILDKVKDKNYLHGLDINIESINFARDFLSDIKLTCGDGHKLPFDDNVFDVLLCHFLLLWVAGPSKVLEEMIRVGKPGGKILILAEPDYPGRIDYPDELVEIGKAQTKSLIAQGADVKMGRKLASLLSAAGLLHIETGLLGGQWNTEFSQEEWEMEWQVIESDIIDLVPEDELKELRNFDLQASKNGSRILFVPTFYGYGIIP